MRPALPVLCALAVLLGARSSAPSAPVVTVRTDPVELSPANRKMRDVHASVSVDACRQPCEVTLDSLSVSETAPGATGGAELGTEDYDFQLRSEGAGRVYTIVYRAIDRRGRAGYGRAQVTVP